MSQLFGLRVQLTGMTINSFLPKAGLVSLLLAVQLVFAGDVSASCGSGTDDRPAGVIIGDKVRESSAVFSGKVTGFAYRKGTPNEYAEGLVREQGLDGYETKVVIFAVDRWWKGDLAMEVELVTEETKLSNGMGTNSSSNYNFEAGKSYIVSAYQTPHGLTANRCNGLTGPATRLKDLITHIGEGNRPVDWRAPTDL